MSDDASGNINPEILAHALRRLNRFHLALFWAENYHELTYNEIADRLRIPEELVASQMRVMIARFVLAAEDVEIGRPERRSAKAKRLFGSLAWTIKLKLWAFRTDYFPRRRKPSEFRN